MKKKKKDKTLLEWVDSILKPWEKGDLRGKKMSEEPKEEAPQPMYHLTRGGKSFCGGEFTKILDAGTAEIMNIQKIGKPCPHCVKMSIESDTTIPKDVPFDLNSESQSQAE